MLQVTIANKTVRFLHMGTSVVFTHELKTIVKWNLAFSFFCDGPFSNLFQQYVDEGFSKGDADSLDYLMTKGFENILGNSTVDRNLLKIFGCILLCFKKDLIPKRWMINNGPTVFDVEVKKKKGIIFLNNFPVLNEKMACEHQTMIVFGRLTRIFYKLTEK